MKKILCSLIVIILLLYFIFFPQDALHASRQGLLLWYRQILPALLPFSILSYLILRTRLFSTQGLGRRSRITMEEWYVILCGFLFGFPIGSKLTADLCHEDRISGNRAQILCAFTNNLSPIFVTTAMQEILAMKPNLPFYLLLYGIPFLYGIILLLFKDSEDTYKQKNTASRFQINMQIVDAGIINGFETLIKICGYIMMFSILTQMLLSVPWNHTIIPVLLSGCLEVTTGVATLGQSDITGSYKYILALFMLSFNGICGLCQTASILSQTNLSMRSYCKHKLIIVLLVLTGGIGLLFFRRLC